MSQPIALQDHFHAPLSTRRHWHAFHHAWATYIASDLNQRLPEGYFAEPNVQFGIEIDVATLEELGRGRSDGAAQQPTGPSGAWIAPAPTMSIPLPIIIDAVEVLVYNREAGPTLAGAIELVSPANKDRPAHRDAFLSKCVAYLQQALGLVVVDIVTDRRTDLHQELLSRLGSDAAATEEANLYAAAYRPVERSGEACLDLWHEELAVGLPLPTMPLWLPGSLSLPVDLETTYGRTCRELRLIVHAA